MGKPKGKYIHPDPKKAKKDRERSRGKKSGLIEQPKTIMANFVRGKR